jgi:acetyl esterase
VIDPELQEVLRGLEAPGAPPAHEVPLQQARAAHVAEAELLSGPGEPVAEVHEMAIPAPGGEVAARAFVPEGESPLPVVVYLHGGGWVFGTLDSFDTVGRALANASGAIVIVVDYRLAPEHPFPAGLEDAMAAVRWAAAHAGEVGGDPGRLAVAGDSAGGNLATVAARRLRGEVELRLQALVYPVCDAGVNTPSYRECADGYGLTAASMRRFWDLYLDGSDGFQPDASPLRADDLARVAPAYVITAEHDPLRDEGEAYAAALARAGVPVELRRYPGAVHGFWRWLAVADCSRRAVGEVGAALRRALA